MSTLWNGTPDYWPLVRTLDNLMTEERVSCSTTTVRWTVIIIVLAEFNGGKPCSPSLLVQSNKARGGGEEG